MSTTVKAKDADTGIIEKRIKVDDLSVDHLSWLVDARYRNQQACLAVFSLFEKYPDMVGNTEFRTHSQSLVAVGFSLWRAAFLADKSGQRDAVFADAKTFLARILTDNAINYPQDRSSREWTFNYYVTNATNGLLKLSERWPKIAATLSKAEKVRKGSKPPHRRWNRHQTAFELAIEYLQADLEAQKGTKGTARRRAKR